MNEQELLSEAYTIVVHIMNKWGHKSDCLCRACEWLREAEQYVEIPMGENSKEIKE